MYICNCNGITRKQVEAARRNGATAWSEVYAHYGCAPCCGKCIPEICRHLDEGNSRQVAAPFGIALQGV